MKTVKKNCANCQYGCDAPASMKPVYGYGGLMLVCTRSISKGKTFLTAPLNKCRNWLSGKKYNEQCEAALAEARKE